MGSIFELMPEWVQAGLIAVLCGLFVLTICSAIASIFEWGRNLIRFLPRQWAGCVAMATITGCRQDADRCYVPLVSFTTRRGELRAAVPVAGTDYTDPPLRLDQPYDLRQLREEVYRWESDEADARAPAPPIGETAAIVYDPIHPAAVRFRFTRVDFLMTLAFTLLVGFISLGWWIVPWVVASAGPWIGRWVFSGPTPLLAYVVTGLASVGFVLGFAAAATLLKYARHRSLERRGHVAPASGGFRWNPHSAQYEPVLTFTTRTGQPRQRILGASFDYTRLPHAATVNIIYDPHDEDFAEPSYDGAHTVRPTSMMIIAASVALLVLVAMMPYLVLLWLPVTIIAIGFGLGVLAAKARATRWRSAPVA